MRTRSFLTLALSLSVLLSLLFTGVAAAGGDSHQLTLFATRLSGAAELPGPGDADGRGVALLSVNAETGRICHVLRARDIEPATATHIHQIQNPDGSGPVVQGLNPPTSGTSKGCAVNAEVAQGLVENPAEYYVNVHNEPFPDGAIRGNLD